LQKGKGSADLTKGDIWHGKKATVERTPSESLCGERKNMGKEKTNSPDLAVGFQEKTPAVLARTS